MNALDATGSILSAIIQYPSRYSKVYPYRNIFENEDFILFYYIGKCSEMGSKLTRKVLEKNLYANATRWLMRNSLVRKNNPDSFSDAYLESKSMDALLTAGDKENVFCQLVLDRFDEVSLNKVPEDTLESILNLAPEMSKQQIGDQLLDGLVKLMSSPQKIDREVYTKSDIIDYAKATIDKYERDFIGTNNTSLYSKEVSNQFITALSSRKQCFNWNLGPIDMPKVKYSDMVSVLGVSKVGKTRFVMGEMVYPTLLKGQNVLILSGEMSIPDILSFITIKHLYMQHSMKVGLDTCTKVIGISEVVSQLGIGMSDAMDIVMSDDKNSEYYEKLVIYRPYIEDISKLPLEAIEVIILTFNEIVDPESKIGTPFLLDKDSGVFSISQFMPMIRAEIDAKDIKMVVVDHMGLIEADNNTSKTEVMTLAYQQIKQIAKSDVNPVVTVAINHIDTSSEDKMMTSKSGDLVGARAFNTNESKKSADLEIVLYRTEESKREGMILLQIPFSRWEDAPSGNISLVSDYMVSDFCIPGVIKEPYQ